MAAADGTTHKVALDYYNESLRYFQLSLSAEDQPGGLPAAMRDKEKSNTLAAMARILRQKHAYLEAEQHALRALEFSEFNCDAYQNYAGMLLLAGKAKEAISLLDRFFRAAGSAWESAREKLTQTDAPWFISEQEAWEEFISLHSLRLFSLNYLAGTSLSPLHVYQEHVKWGAMVQERFKEMKFRSWSNVKDAERKIRLGYVSPDLLSNHAVARFLDHVIAKHSRQQFHVTIFLHRSSGARHTSEGVADELVFTYGKNTAEVVGMIQEHGIDLLLDLAGHTSGNRLDVFACSPASFGPRSVPKSDLGT